MFIIIDKFYNNAEEVRQYALSLDYTVSGNYPGMRTEACDETFRDNIKRHFEMVLGKRITYFPGEYNTAFQYTTEEATTWVHHDATKWAAVLYLTPDAPIESGTGIYRHKHTGIYLHEAGQIDYNDTPQAEEDWEMIAHAGNMFNRLVIYNGFYYHRSILPGFGTDKETGRLFQTFFFDTEEL